MKKILAGVLLGGIVYFVAGAVTWMVFPWHARLMKKIPEETLVRDTLKVVVQEPGMYFFPNRMTQNGLMEDKPFEELYKSGPSGLLIFRPAGDRPMNRSNFIIGLIEALVTAFFGIIALILTRDRIKSYGSRVLAIIILGVFVWFNSHIPYWNWFHFPSAYILLVMFDSAFCFGLMGLVLAKFIPEEN